MNKKKVLISAPYFLPVVERFRPVFDKHNMEMVVASVQERLEEKDLLKLIGDIDGVICGDDRFTEKVLKSAPKLKVISKWGTGIDSINQDACRRLGIAVKNTPNAFTQPVADSVMCYILTFARKIPWMDKDMKQGIWKKIPGVALNETTLGIIGMGNIGKAVARRAVSFGMRVLGNDIKDIDRDFLKEVGVEMVEKDKIYAEADFISLNCDLNPTSKHILKAEVFQMMKKKPYVINASRGPLIKEADLVKALKSGRIAGAGLDVFEEEPLPKKSPLLKMDNVLMAAHNSNSSPRAWEHVHQNKTSLLFSDP